MHPYPFIGISISPGIVHIIYPFNKWKKGCISAIVKKNAKANDKKSAK
jgi:hypothetical protein